MSELEKLAAANALLTEELEQVRKDAAWAVGACAEFPDYLTIIDDERKFVWTNRVHPRLTMDQVLNSRLEDFAPNPAAREALLAAVEECRVQGAAQVQTEAVVEGERLYSETRMVKMDGHILVITKHVTDQVVAEMKLRASLSEKRLLLREVHHRLRNGLQLVSSILGLRASGVGPARKVIEDARARIHAMASVHEALFIDAADGHFGITSFARSLAEELWIIHGSPDVVLDISEEPERIRVEASLAMPLGLVLYELLSNALRHAFPAGWAEPCRIQVHAQRTGNEALVLRVSDNGIGMPDGALESAGTRSGLGLMRALVGQVAGSITVDPGPGSAFLIELQPFPSAPSLGSRLDEL